MSTQSQEGNQTYRFIPPDDAGKAINIPSQNWDLFMATLQREEVAQLFASAEKGAQEVYQHLTTLTPVRSGSSS